MTTPPQHGLRINGMGYWSLRASITDIDNSTQDFVFSFKVLLMDFCSDVYQAETFF
jgi:hypothetical protein